MATKILGSGSGKVDLKAAGAVNGDIIALQPGNYDEISAAGTTGLTIKSNGVVGINRINLGNVSALKFDGPIARGNYANGFKFIGSGTKIAHNGGNNINVTLNGFDSDGSYNNIVDFSNDGPQYNYTDASMAFAGLHIENLNAKGTGNLFLQGNWNHPKTLKGFSRDVVFKTINLNIASTGSDEKVLACNTFRFRAIDWTVTGRGNNNNDVGLIHIEGGNAGVVGMIRDSRFGYCTARIWVVVNALVAGDQTTFAIACLDKSGHKYGFLSARIDATYLQSNDAKMKLTGGNVFVLNNTQANSNDDSGAYKTNPNLLAGGFIDDLGKPWNMYQYNNAVANVQHINAGEDIYKHDGEAVNYFGSHNISGPDLASIDLDASFKPIGPKALAQGIDLTSLPISADVRAYVTQYIKNPAKPDVGAIQVSGAVITPTPTPKQRTVVSFDYDKATGKTLFTYDDGTTSKLPV